MSLNPVKLKGLSVFRLPNILGTNLIGSAECRYCYSVENKKENKKVSSPSPSPSLPSRPPAR